MKRIFAILIALTLGFSALSYAADKGRASSEKQIRVHFYDELGSNQLREEIEISIDGRNVGKLTVNEKNRVARLAVTLQAGITFKYQLGGYSYIKHGGDMKEFLVTGSGELLVSDGATFELHAFSQSNDVITLMLVKKSN
jgi:hypothetical protein